MPRVFEISRVFLGDLGVEREDRVQLVGRQEVPEAHLAAGGRDLRVVGDEPLLDLGVHAPVDAADALHQAHRVPVDVVVDHPRGVLEVEAFREDVGGDQDADLRAALLGERWRRCAVVVGREALNDVGAIALGGAVDLGDAVDAGLDRAGASGSGRCRRTR